MRSVLFLIPFFTLFAALESADLNWWKKAVFYQIYPRSFKDVDNDGIGDLLGIIEKVATIKYHTQVDAIWLSPIFESPQVDQGYDISDYLKIDPDYGSIYDFITLIDLAQSVKLKVILDFVPNHTSNKHQWFIYSEDRIEGYEDFYVWADGKIDESGNRLPPNNWVSVFKNSSWEWSERRQQYYLHQFTAAQPDLNYRNPQVKAAMAEILQYWLLHGVDGFRIDAARHLFEDPNLADEPLSGLPGYTENDYEYLNHTLTADLQETYDLIYEWRELIDNFTLQYNSDQRLLITEAYIKDDLNKTMLYYGTPDGSRLGAHFTFNFGLIEDINITSTAYDIAREVSRWLEAIPKIYISNWVLGNHDTHRVATRLDPRNVDGFNFLVMFLPGIAVTYNGEEIGQENGDVSFEEGKDPRARDPDTFEQLSRDFERTPYQWDETVNGGFNDGTKPWLPVSQKYLVTNYESEYEWGNNTHYTIYQYGVGFKKVNVLTEGSTVIVALNEKVLLLARTLVHTTNMLVFNIGDNEQTVDLTGFVNPTDNRVMRTSVGSQFNTQQIISPESLTLLPHEAIVINSVTY